MKVSEAKEKVCPFIEDAFWIDATCVQSNTARNITCICGDCMAWEFVDKKQDQMQVHGIYKIVKVDYETEYGYCSRLSNE